MRVALITDGVWPYVLGGMQKHSYFLCKYLAKNKIYVDLFHFNQSAYKIELLEFFTEEERNFINSFVVDFPGGLKFPGHYIYKSYLHSKQIGKLLLQSENKYDFIYTKGLTGWYLLTHLKQNKFSTATIGVKFHGYEMFQKAPNFITKIQHIFLLRYPVKKITRRADVVFSYGGKITEIIKLLGVPENKIVELASGIEEQNLINTIRESDEARRFVFLGRYERRKGIEELNQAIKKIIELDKLNNKIEFHFIGPIPDSKKVIHPIVIYHGEIRDKTLLQKTLCNGDVLICPSWSEGLPNVILEAMASGLAVIATDVGATSILVSKSNGWLLPSNDKYLLTEVIIEAAKCSNHELNSKKKNALLHVKEQFNWNTIIQSFITKCLEK
jgi:glycosyltransferase involved in cell wall biosynthesis